MHTKTFATLGTALALVVVTGWAANPNLPVGVSPEEQPPLTDPKALVPPAQVTCMDVPKGIETNVMTRGNIPYIFRLRAGPYLSEYETAEGTYYRAPSGGIYRAWKGKENEPEGIFTHITWDGGVWIPRDPSRRPHLYHYAVGLQASPVLPLPEGFSCSNATFVRNHDEVKHEDSIAIAMYGAAGGAVGGALGRAMVPNSSLSYRQAAGAGAAAGLVVGAIVAVQVNDQFGKIEHWVITDEAFAARMQQLRQSAVALSALEIGRQ
jgi:hypothetical protein